MLKSFHFSRALRAFFSDNKKTYWKAQQPLCLKSPDLSDPEHKNANG